MQRWNVLLTIGALAAGSAFLNRAGMAEAGLSDVREEFVRLAAPVIGEVTGAAPTYHHEPEWLTSPLSGMVR